MNQSLHMRHYSLRCCICTPIPHFPLPPPHPAPPPPHTHTYSPPTPIAKKPELARCAPSLKSGRGGTRNSRLYYVVYALLSHPWRRLYILWKRWLLFNNTRSGYFMPNSIKTAYRKSHNHIIWHTTEDGLLYSSNPAVIWRFHNVALTSMQRHGVASTLMRRCETSCARWKHPWNC